MNAHQRRKLPSPPRAAADIAADQCHRLFRRSEALHAENFEIAEPRRQFRPRHDARPSELFSRRHVKPPIIAGAAAAHATPRPAVPPALEPYRRACYAHLLYIPQRFSPQSDCAMHLLAMELLQSRGHYPE